MYQRPLAKGPNYSPLLEGSISLSREAIFFPQGKNNVIPPKLNDTLLEKFLAWYR